MKRPLLMVCFCLVAVLALYDFCTASASSARDTVFREGQEIIATGYVCQKDNGKFYIKSVTIQNIINEAFVSQPQTSDYDLKQMKISCEYPKEGKEGLQEPEIGSFIAVRGNWQNFSAATNPGEFDARKYYKSIQIAGELTDTSILIEKKSFFRIGEALYRLRCKLEKRLYQVFPEKEAGILGRMLLGQKEGLDKNVKELYQKNGIIHILSISGLHISLIGMGIFRLLRKCGMAVVPAAICGCAVLFLYGSMCGMSISVYRAIGMYFLRMLSLVFGRTYDLLTALGVMAAVMALQNPACFNNAGFLLSFTPVLGIGLVYPGLMKDPEKAGSVKKAFLSGISVTLFTLPVQLWFFYEVPVWSLFLNLIVIPCLSILVISGLAAMLIPGLGILGTLDCLFLTGFEKLCLLFGKLPFQSWNPGRPGIWQIALYYGGLLLTIRLTNLPKTHKIFLKEHIGFSKKNISFLKEHIGFPKKNISFLKAHIEFPKKHIRFPDGCIKFIIITGLVLLLGWHPVHGADMTFLNVGQGDCACLRLASGEVYLFDCGSVSRGRVGEYVLLPFLKYNGINRLDAVFVSHADRDHYSGVEELFLLAEQEGIAIEQLVLPGGENREILQEEFEELLLAARKYGERQPLAIRAVQAGDSWNCGEGSFLTLNPCEDRAEWDKNAASQCLYIEIGNRQKKGKVFTLLLTGDVEGQGEENLTAQLEKYGIYAVDVLKVAHHGSRYSTSDEFLRQISPKMAVISCGKQNAYGHPHQELLDRLEMCRTKICCTPDSGAVAVRMEKGKLRIKTYAAGSDSG